MVSLEASGEVGKGGEDEIEIDDEIDLELTPPGGETDLIIELG